MPRPQNSSPQTKLLLQVLAAAPKAWRHGFSLSQETGLASGTLYPLLIRLADQGYLEARWEIEDRNGKPPRHAYRLTAAGLRLAKEAASSKRPLARLRPAFGKTGR